LLALALPVLLALPLAHPTVRAALTERIARWRHERGVERDVAARLSSRLDTLEAGDFGALASDAELLESLRRGEEIGGDSERLALLRYALLLHLDLPAAQCLQGVAGERAALLRRLECGDRSVTLPSDLFADQPTARLLLQLRTALLSGEPPSEEVLAQALSSPHPTVVAFASYLAEPEPAAAALARSLGAAPYSSHAALRARALGLATPTPDGASLFYVPRYEPSPTTPSLEEDKQP
jgi:hypothetical protein